MDLNCIMRTKCGFIFNAQFSGITHCHDSYMNTFVSCELIHLEIVHVSHCGHLAG